MDSRVQNRQYSLVGVASISANTRLKALNPFLENFDSDIAKN
jgi:hypothetical protein